MEKDQQTGTQNYSKRRENIFNISVTVFKESNEKLPRSKKNVILKSNRKAEVYEQ